MSNIFYDNLIALDKVEAEIKKAAKTQEEREELWAIVDEIVHHRALGCILDHLPRHNHEEFLVLFKICPHDGITIFNFLRGKIGDNVEELLKQELGGLAYELLAEIKEVKKPSGKIVNDNE